MKSQTKYNPNKILTHILTGKIKKDSKRSPFCNTSKKERTHKSHFPFDHRKMRDERITTNVALL